MMRIFDDFEQFSHATADLFVRQAREAIARRGRFTVALSGGRTPRRAYELLAEHPRREQVRWPLVHVFWSDERCVPAHDERSNARMAFQALLHHVPVCAGQVHPIRCDGDPEAAAAAYDGLIGQFLDPEGIGPDLLILGLGHDGHIASLFPGTEGIKEHKRRVVDLYRPQEGLHRVSLTPETINGARTILFLISGLDKAPTLKAVLEGPRDPFQLPAQLIRPRKGRLIWFLDQPAASALEKVKA